MDILWGLEVFLKSKAWIVNEFSVGGDIYGTFHHSLICVGRRSHT